MTPLHFLEQIATQQRLTIIQALRKHGCLKVGEVGAQAHCGYNQASKALLELKRAGIVLAEYAEPFGAKMRVGGRPLVYRLRPEMVAWYDLTIHTLGVIGREAVRGT